MNDNIVNIIVIVSGYLLTRNCPLFGDSRFCWVCVLRLPLLRVSSENRSM